MFPMLYAKLTGFFANFNYRPREFAARAKAGELLCDRKTSIMTSSAGSREVAGQLTVFVRDPEGKAKTAGDVDFASVQQGRAFVKYIKEFTQAAEVLIAEMEQLERSFKESPRS